MVRFHHNQQTTLNSDNTLAKQLNSPCSPWIRIVYLATQVTTKKVYITKIHKAEVHMKHTLEPHLERAAELGSRIVGQERMVTGSSAKAPLPRLNANSAKEAASNASIPSAKSHSQCTIESDFPHIMEKLVLVWGYPECFSYLSELIIDNRGNRKGFDMDIMGDLMLLLKITEHVTPDMWLGAPGDHR